MLGVMLVGWRQVMSAMEGDATMEQTRSEAMQRRRESGVKICRRMRRRVETEGSIGLLSSPNPSESMCSSAIEHPS
jgi:hypothetical protein